jgi:hypothetical protein
VARAVVSYPNRGERVYWYAGVWLDVLLVVFLEFTSISCCAASNAAWTHYGKLC